MSRCKGTNIVFLRKLLEKTGREAEPNFLARLTPEETEIYHAALPVSWIEVETIAHLFEAAAAVIYPGDPLGLRWIGQDLARDNLSGVYKSFMRFTTINFVIGQSAKIWNIYQEKGKARTEKDPHQNQAVFIVEDFPELPKSFREEIAGYILGTAEFTGIRNIRVTPEDADPKSWKWIITWE